MACIHGFEPGTSIEVGGLEGLSFQVVEVKEMVPCVLRPLELGNPAIQTLGGDVLSDSVERVLWVAPNRHGWKPACKVVNFLGCPNAGRFLHTSRE